jgi:hypothetical protein
MNLHPNHAQYRITLSTTDIPHHEPSNHASTTGTPHDEPRTTNVPHTRPPPHHQKRDCCPRSPSRPTGCRSAAASALDNAFKNFTISRAQRSAGTAGWVGWPLTLACRCGMSAPHGTTGGRRNHTPHSITPAQRTPKRKVAPHNEQSVRVGTTPARCTTSLSTTTARRAPAPRACACVMS